jgi:5,10-methylenetetrahydromethanopterin reductase
MEFGLFLTGHRGCWDDAAFAESSGFSSVGLEDSQMLGGELFATLALVAQATRSIRVGTFLAVPHNRSSPVAAQGIATINALAPGRTYFATGSGFTSRNVIGLPPVKVDRLREYATEVRSLLDGKEIDFTEGGRTRPVRFRQVEGRYLNLENRVPVYVAGDGPRTRQVAGEIGDGWVTTMQTSMMMSPQTAADFAQAAGEVRQAAVAAGRDPAGLYTMLSTTCCVLRPGERLTDERVLARVGPGAMLPFHSAATRPEIVDYFPPSWRDRYVVYRRRVLDGMDQDRLHQEVHRGHLTHLLDGEAEVLTDEIIRATTITGTADEVTGFLQALEEADLRNITLNFPTDLIRDGVSEVAHYLMPALAGRSAPAT